MNQLPRPLANALKRRRNAWNWTLQTLAFLVFCLALWSVSNTLFGVGLVCLGASLFELHLPDMDYKPIWRIMRMERDWLEHPWDGRKRRQALVLILIATGLFWSLAVHDIGLLLLVVGIAALFWVAAAQARLSPPEDPDEPDPFDDDIAPPLQ